MINNIEGIRAMMLTKSLTLEFRLRFQEFLPTKANEGQCLLVISISRRVCGVTF